MEKQLAAFPFLSKIPTTRSTEAFSCHCKPNKVGLGRERGSVCNGICVARGEVQSFQAMKLLCRNNYKVKSPDDFPKWVVYFIHTLQTKAKVTELRMICKMLLLLRKVFLIKFHMTIVLFYFGLFEGLFFSPKESGRKWFLPPNQRGHIYVFLLMCPGNPVERSYW